MAYTRRHFSRVLQTGLAMTVLAPYSNSLSADDAAGPRDSAKSSGWRLDRRYFSPLVGSVFWVRSSEYRSSLRLTSIEDNTPRVSTQAATDPKIECSILRFSVSGAMLKEGTYELEHARAGRFHLHLAPGRPGLLLAYLSHVPPDDLASMSIPQRGSPRLRENADAARRLPGVANSPNEDWRA